MSQAGGYMDRKDENSHYHLSVAPRRSDSVERFTRVPVPFEFVTACPLCGKQFTLVWLMDPVRVGPESIAEITCPICGKRFHLAPGNLLPVPNRPNNLAAGRPVRTSELVYDCPSCGMRGLTVTLVHTDLSWEELSRETIEFCVCSHSPCPKRGLQQNLHPTRTGFGALNPSLG